MNRTHGSPTFLGSDLRRVILVFAIAAGVRLACVAATFHGNDAVTSWEDVSIANNLLKGNGFQLDNSWRVGMLYGNVVEGVNEKISDLQIEGARPTTLKQPLFPLLLATVFYFFGPGNFLAVFIVHSILAGLTAAILYIALRGQSERIAALFAGGYALYPPFVYQCATSPESTILLLFLFSLFVYQAVTIYRDPGFRNFCLLGLVSGFLVMTNFGAIAFITAAICFTAIVVSNKFSAVALRAAAAGLVVMAIISPWLARNYRTFGRLAMRASTGHELLKSRVEAGYGLLVPEQMLLDLEKRGRTLNEIEEGEMLEQAIRAEIRWPATVPSTVAMNLWHFWWEPPRYSQDHSLSYLLGRRLPYYVLLLLSMPVLAHWLARSSRFPRVMRQNLVEGLAVMLIATETVVYGYWGGWNIRYHFATELALMLFAAQGAAAILRFVRSDRMAEHAI